MFVYEGSAEMTHRLFVVLLFEKDLFGLVITPGKWSWGGMCGLHSACGLPWTAPGVHCGHHAGCTRPRVTWRASPRPGEVEASPAQPRPSAWPSQLPSAPALHLPGSTHQTCVLSSSATVSSEKVALQRAKGPLFQISQHIPFRKTKKRIKLKS